MKYTLFTPTYNRADILPALYKSLEVQTFKDFEWLVIDDGSKDNTEEVINERLEKAKKEITLASLYQYNVVNDTPENAANAIKEIIIKNSK